MEYFLLLLGFTILLISGNLLVRAGVSLATHLRVSTLAIGVTIVSLGTSAPELVVSISAVFKELPDIALGNVIGSNISNIGLVLGLTALILPLNVDSGSVSRDWPFMMLSSLIFYFFAFNGILSWIEGIVLLSFLTGYLYITFRSSRREMAATGHRFEKADYSVFGAVILVIISSAGLYFGSRWLVTSASEIATNLGISERVIAVSLIAFGTSVPELATSVAAAVKKQMSITIGNIIGSNIFNILAIPGITGIIKRIPVSSEILFDIRYMLGISVLLFLLMLPSKKSKINRKRGVLLLLSYAVYIFIVFFLQGKI